MLSHILRTPWEKRRKHSAQQLTDAERDRLISIVNEMRK